MDFGEIRREINQTGYLSHRYTRKDHTSREWGYYISLESAENCDIEFRYAKGRIHGDIFEKLGLIEDILEVISIDQLMALVKTKGKR